MNEIKEVGRNEPCPCGSQKKYKRCHGVDAAPILGTPSAGRGMPSLDQLKEAAPGFDPSKMDPAMMSQMTAAFQRLPKGQLIKMQQLMQKAMSGKDITSEAAVFEKSLPPGFQEMMMSQMGGLGGMPGLGGAMDGLATTQTPDLSALSQALPGSGMTEAEALKIIEAAKASGKISEDEADKVLEGKKKSGLFSWMKK